MADRRSLADGISVPKPEVEKEFVQGGKPPPTKPPAAGSEKILPQMASRVPITTRARPEIASALKRASLERQLSGEQPFYVQEILEEAISAWLKSHGYLGS